MNKQRILCLLLLLCFLLTGGVGVALATGDTDDGYDNEADSAYEEEEDRSDWTIDDYRNELDDINDNIDELEAEIAAQKTLISQAVQDIASLDARLITVNQQLTVTQKQIDATNESIAKLQLQIDELQRRLDARMDTLKERLVDIYVYGDVSLLDVVFKSSSFQDFVTMYDMVETLVDNDKELAQEIETERQSIEAEQQKLQQAKDDLEAVKADQYSMLADLQQLEQEKKALLDEANMSLEESQALYQSEMAAAAAATERIQELMASSDPTLSYGGMMMWPLPAQWDRSWVTSEYGWRTHPVYGYALFHSGIDIAADGGTPIYAAADGRIILREYYGGYGYCIMIDHGSGVVSLYGHQSSFGDYYVGDYVEAGTVIGYVGTTGTSTGNHLHFETRYNGEYVSPWTYLQ
ncbi:MAG: peptidoglycan DD-metalloendopeptidase family protein [Firmicutes bacterium]|nr:peptidoglycan DD-metalloendopeptidase family protein [Bacillota bacterium]